MSRRTRGDAAQAAVQQANEAARQFQEQAAPEARNEAPSEQAPEKPEVDTRARLEPRNDPHDQGMDAILKARGILDEEKEAEKPAEPKAPEKPKEPAPAEAKVETPAASAPADEPLEPAVEAPKTVHVKVDGEEFDVPQADVDDAGGVANYQRERASENRLKKTNESLAETRRLQAEIAAWMARSAPKEEVKTDDQFIAERIETIRFGSAEESAKALKEVLARSSKQIDPSTLTAMAVNEVNENMAVQGFGREFADVVSNPLLMKLAQTLENERKRDLKAVPDWNLFYRSIGNEIRSVTGKPHQPAPATQVAADSTSQPTKEERKASIVNLPTAAARAALPEAEKPETRADVLNDMRRARGIPTG